MGFGLTLLAGLGACSRRPFMAATPTAHRACWRRPAISTVGVILVVVVNGTFEEVFLLGFLQRGLQARGTSIALGVTLLVRVLYHLYQGPLGALSILAFGLVQGLWYARSKRLWSPVFAHIMCDIVAFLAITHH